MMKLNESLVRGMLTSFGTWLITLYNSKRVNRSRMPLSCFIDNLIDLNWHFVDNLTGETCALELKVFAQLTYRPMF